MRMANLLLFILMFFAANLLGQTTDLKTNVAGKWVMVKHIYLKNGKSVEVPIPTTKITYEFNNDGTYKWSCTMKYKGKWYTNVTAGEWKISSDNKNIELFNNKILPPNDKDQCGDYQLPIKKITATDFETEEYLFSEGIPGRSTYKKLTNPIK